MKTSTKIYLLFVFLLVLTGTISAQIGINTLQPDPNAVLDIQSADKGIKLPDIKDPSVMNPPADSSGYLIYHSTSKKFRYWNNQEWETVNPLSVDKDENVTAPGKLKVDGDSVLAPYTTVKANNFVGYGTIPLRGIIMWSGNVTEIPDGWALCDGTVQNGYSTPDLRGRFIAGYSGSGDYETIGVGAGGVDNISLSINNLPPHQHDIGKTKGGTLSTGAHQHSIRVPYRGYEFKGTGGSHDYTTYDDGVYATYFSTGVTGEHDHSGSTGKEGGVYYAEQSHTDITGSPDKLLPKASCPVYQECISSCNGNAICISDCDNVYNYMCSNPQYNPNYGKKVIDSPEHWDVQPIDNRPAYYVLAFIMRVK